MLYEGIANHSANIWGYLKWLAASVVGGAIAIVLFANDWVTSPLLALLWFVGAPGLLWNYMVHASRKYKVSRRRVETEHGVLSKTVDSLELWRVLDVRYEQSLFDRLLGNARITLIGTDQTDAALVLHGLPDHRRLFEALRDAVQLARHGNRPMELVPGQEGMDVAEMM